MGNIWSNSLDKQVKSLFDAHNEQARIICCGLDAAGKTTIFYKLKFDELCTAIPTIGFNVETIESKSFKITSWDVGGEDKIRSLWRHYFPLGDAFIWVIDGNDHDRHQDSCDELRWVVKNGNQAKPFLIFMNKTDLSNHMNAMEFVEKYRIHEIFVGNRDWYIVDCCAVTGDGLYEGFRLLSSAMQGRPEKMGYHLDGYFKFMKLYQVMGWQPALHMGFPRYYRKSYVWSLLLMYERKALPLDVVKHILSFVGVVDSSSDSFARKIMISENFTKYEHMILNIPKVKKLLEED